MSVRKLSDADVEALADAIIKKQSEVEATVDTYEHCLLGTLFPKTEEGLNRFNVFKDLLDFLTRCRNVLGTLSMFILGVVVLGVVGVLCYLISLGKINIFKFFWG